MLTHDLIAIGFGPSNIALAAALDEQRQAGTCIDALFIERQPDFVWHPGMLLKNAHMQISFLKDLATPRNPASRFTFINYLYEKQRLHDFINLKTFYPSRHEFNDYFSWAAAQFEDQCAYGEEVCEILPEMRGGKVALLRVRSRDRSGAVHERLARNLVVSIGGVPNIPESFLPYRDDGRIFHSHNYLRSIEANGDAQRIAVVGAGQSAAEIFLDLIDRPNAPRVDLIMRARALKPSDSSPFVNEVFNPDFIDHVFSRTEDERRELLHEFRHTNYACPDLALIEQIYKIFYEQQVTGDAKHRFLRRHEIGHVHVGADGIELALSDLNTGRASTARYDAIVLATGYGRQQHRTLLAPLAPFLGDMAVDRNYRVEAPADFLPNIFLQGASEASHGLSDTLLSVTALRTGEICETLLRQIRASRQRMPADAAL